MKLFCQVIFLIVSSANLVLGDCDVYAEINRINNDISACFEHAYNETSQPLDFVRQYANYRLNLEEATVKINDYCHIFERQYEDCLVPANMANDDICGNHKTVYGILEANDIGFQMDSFLCANDAYRYLDFLQDDGSDCFAKNDNYETCLDNYYKSHADSELNKCDAFELGLECAQAYEVCDNRNVKRNFDEVNYHLKYTFECLD